MSPNATPPWWRRRTHSRHKHTRHRDTGPAVRHLMFRNFSAPRIRSKTGFGDRVVPEAHRQTSRRHTAAAMGDVGKRAPVDESRCMFQRPAPDWAGTHPAAEPSWHLPRSASRPSPRIRNGSVPRTIRPRRVFRSSRLSARHRMAITSDAAVMSNPSARGTPLLLPPSPLVMCRSCRSFMSRQRRQETWSGSMSRRLPWKMWLSVMAANRLLAAVTAWMSPVEVQVDVLHGHNLRIAAARGTALHSRRPGRATVHGALPPHVFPIRASASPRPTVVVVFPSPAGVGVSAVTRIRRPGLFRAVRRMVFRKDFCLSGSVQFNIFRTKIQSAGNLFHGFRFCGLRDFNIGWEGHAALLFIEHGITLPWPQTSHKKSVCMAGAGALVYNERGVKPRDRTVRTRHREDSNMQDGFIRVATATPAIRVADCRYNADAVLAIAREASDAGVQLLVFPELCLTGYTCGGPFSSGIPSSGGASGIAADRRQDTRARHGPEHRPAGLPARPAVQPVPRSYAADGSSGWSRKSIYQTMPNSMRNGISPTAPGTSRCASGRRLFPLGTRAAVHVHDHIRLRAGRGDLRGSLGAAPAVQQRRTGRRHRDREPVGQR